MKRDISDIKQNIRKMNDTMDTISLITLSEDTNCPYNQRIKINNILKKQTENFIRKFTNENPNNSNNNQINANIPINTTPARKIKINTPFKNDNHVFGNKNENRKYRTVINLNNTNNASKINLNKKQNIADSSRDNFSSKKSDSKKYNNLSIKTKNDSIYSFNDRISFNYINFKKRKYKDSSNPFRMDINKKKDKKQKKYAKVSKTSINK